MEVSKLSKEKQQLMSEVDERKRKMLREVEVNYIHTQCYMYIYSLENVCTCTCNYYCTFYSQLKVVELTDALESSGSYTKAEIAERVKKFREKLMQVCDSIVVDMSEIESTLAGE